MVVCNPDDECWPVKHGNRGWPNEELLVANQDSGALPSDSQYAITCDVQRDTGACEGPPHTQRDGNALMDDCRRPSESDNAVTVGYFRDWPDMNSREHLCRRLGSSKNLQLLCEVYFTHPVLRIDRHQGSGEEYLPAGSQSAESAFEEGFSTFGPLWQGPFRKDDDVSA
jgi:hypothetical protein